MGRLLCGIACASFAVAARGQSGIFEFDLPAQPLAESIIAAGRLIGANILFESDAVAGRMAPPLRGRLPADQALATLLQGTGLVIRETMPGAFYIQAPPPVAASPAPPQRPQRQPQAAHVQGIEEVIVTAQRREEILQDMPVVVQVVSDRNLQRAGVTDFGSINKVASNIQVFQGAGAPILSIRGIRANAFGAASESPTAVHLNGNYLSQAVSLAGMFYDIERVEVLAGPQGTLFGRNAAAGVINVVTRKPDAISGGGAEIEVGNHDLLRVTGVANAAVRDDLALRIAGQSLTRGGYYDNGLDDADQQSARITASWSPDEISNLLFTADFASNRGRGPADDLIVAGLPGNGLVVDSLKNNDLLYGEGRRAEQHQQFWGSALQYERRMAPGTLTAQASYRDVHQADRLYSAQHLTRPTEYGHAHTVEVRLVSPSEQPWEYLGGLYYFAEQKSGGTGAYATLDSDELPSRIEILGQRTTAAAAFGQIVYTPIEPLHLTAGLRYNYDHKVGSSLEIAPNLRYEQPRTAGHWTNLSWKLGIGYDVTGDHLLFANVATGYKSGTFAYGPEPEIDPQHVLAWEVGTKNRLLSDRLRLNFNAFYYDYRNLEQSVQTPVPGTTYFLYTVVNANGARIHGADLELDWAVTSADRLTLRVNYLDARYRDLDLRSYGLRDYSGLRLVNAPEWAGNLGYARSWTLLSATLDTTLDLQYGSRRGISGLGGYAVDGQPYMQEAYVEIDAAIRYAVASGRWTLTLAGKNLTDEVVLRSANFNIQRGNNVYGQLAAPRTFSLILGWNFQ